MPHLSPAEYVIAKLGGVRATARAIGRHPSTISKWKKPRVDRGCDGQVPGGAWKPIIEFAKIHNIDITLADLYSGRTIVF